MYGLLKRRELDPISYKFKNRNAHKCLRYKDLVKQASERQNEEAGYYRTFLNRKPQRNYKEILVAI